MPNWDPFATEADWQEFEAVVRADVEPRGWDTSEIREGIVADRDVRFGLQNLAQKCRAEPRESWPQIVRDHFDSLFAPGNTLESLTPDQASAALRARLLEDDFMAHVDWEPVTRRVAEDLQLVLAYDLPDQVVIAARERLMELGDEPELWERAIAQTRAEPGIQIERIEVQANDQLDRVPLWTVVGDSFFTAAHALWADELDPPTAALGTLVAVPNRHVVLAHPIRDDSVIGVLSHMISLAARFHREGPGSISSDLYWLRDGQLTRLRAWEDDDGLHFEPGREFESILGSL